MIVTTAGIVQNTKPVQTCTGFVFRSFPAVSNSTNHQLLDMHCKQISLKAFFTRQGSLNRSLAKLIAIFAWWVSIENVNWFYLLGSYEGCSNMNVSGFITFFTYMLRQNGKRFYKGLYVTFKLVPDLKTNTVYLSSYSPWNKGHVSILTNLMLWTYTSDRRAYNSSINRWNFLTF